MNYLNFIVSFFISLITSFFISLITSFFISNIVGIYYLNKLNRDWNKVFEKIKEINIKEIKKHMN